MTDRVEKRRGRREGKESRRLRKTGRVECG